jgi:hypothetical protein
LGILLVSVPLSYVLWQWRYSEHKELAGLSYEAFNERISGSNPPDFWTYALYVTLLVLIVVALVGLVAGVLRVIFPNPTPARQEAKGKK